MAFLIPLIELGELVEGVVLGAEAVGAVGQEAIAGSAIGSSAAAADVSEAMVVDEAALNEAGEEGVSYDQEALDAYENEYMRLPIEEPDIGIGIEEGYPVEGAPYQGDYYGTSGSSGYMLLPQEEVDALDYGNALADIMSDPITRSVITVGAGKAIFAAGMWQFLDPITGAPVYAIAGDDPRVNAIMESLGYTKSAREAGHVLREWFSRLFGYDMPSSPAEPRTFRVSENGLRSRSHPFVLQNQGLKKNSKMSLAANRRKRARSQFVAVPTAAPSIPRAVLKMRMPQRQKKSYTVTRSLCRFVPLVMSQTSGVVSFGVQNKYSLATAGSYLATDGYVWSNNVFAIVSRLADFNEFADLKNAFDQYRIKSLNVTFIPMRDQSLANTGALLPCIIAAEDRDDVLLTGETVEKLSAKEGMKFFRLDSPYTLRCRPQAWSSETANVPKSKVVGGWLPTVNDTVLHYGLKTAPITTTMTGASEYAFTLMIKAQIECKHMS